MTAYVAPGASNRQIVIIISVGADAHEYNARRDEVSRVRPKCCPECGGTHLVGHGWYGRWAIYVDQDVRVEIHRFLSKGCHKTMSLLPDFLHRHRHYVLAVIEAVLRGRLEQGLPWSGLAPSQRSVRRWLGAFVRQALGWQAALLSALARVQPLAGALDPHFRVPGVRVPGVCLSVTHKKRVKIRG